MNTDIVQLNLKNIPCPLNVVKCKLALEKFSKGQILLVDIDRGEPEEMVIRTFEEIGYKINIIKEEMNWIRISIAHEFS